MASKPQFASPAPADVTPDPAPVKAPEAKPVLFLSEGVRNDLILYGTTIDPLTGRTLTRDDLPK